MSAEPYPFHRTFSARDINEAIRPYATKVETLRRALAANAAARKHLRMVVVALLIAQPLVFAIGRGTGDRGMTVREAEAAPVPVPSELPLGTTRFHDETEGATCWLYDLGYRGGLSCLPDQWLKPAQVDDQAVQP